MVCSQTLSGQKVRAKPLYMASSESFTLQIGHRLRGGSSCSKIVIKQTVSPRNVRANILIIATSEELNYPKHPQFSVRFITERNEVGALHSRRSFKDGSNQWKVRKYTRLGLAFTVGLLFKFPRQGMRLKRFASPPWTYLLNVQ